MKKGHVISIGLLALVATVALAQTVFSSLRVNGQSDLRGSIVNGTGNVTVADAFDVDVGGGTDEINVTSGLVTVPGDLTVSGTCTGCGGGGAVIEIGSILGNGTAEDLPAGWSNARAGVGQYSVTTGNTAYRIIMQFYVQTSATVSVDGAYTSGSTFTYTLRIGGSLTDAPHAFVAFLATP